MSRPGTGPRPFGALRWLLLLLLGAAVSLVYFGRYVPSRNAFRQIASPAAASVLVLLAALAAGFVSLAAAGRLFARTRAAEADPTKPDLGHSVLVGVPIFGTILGIVAWMGNALPATVLVLTLLLAAGGVLVLVRSRSWPHLSPTAKDVVLLGPPILLGLIEAVTPVVSDDELVYKLALPHAYLLEGRMIEFPLNTDSYFPASLSLSSLPALAISGGIAAKLVFFVLFLFALRAVYQVSRRVAPGGEAWLTAVVAWTPALLLVEGWCWPDWAILGLLLLSYEAWSRFQETRSAGDAALVALALAGALAGKYTAIPWLVVFVPIVIVQLRRHSMPAGRLITSAAAVLVVFGGFFYLRNLVWTGSPIAPFLLPDRPAVESYQSSDRSGGWTGLIHGDAIVDMRMIDDSLGILLPLSALFSVGALAANGRKRLDLFLLGAAQFAAALAFAPLWRLTLTALAPVALIGAGISLQVEREAPPAARALLRVGAAAALVGQFLLVALLLFLKYDFAPYLVGRESADHYLERKGYVPKAYSWIAANTPTESRVFLLGENRSYYLARRSVGAGNLDGPRMFHYLARFPDPDSFYREARRLGIDYLLVSSHWYRVAGEGKPLSTLEREVTTEVDPSTDRMLRGFESLHARKVYQDPDYDLYAIAK